MSEDSSAEIGQLTEEILEQIIENLDYGDLQNLSRTSTWLRALVAKNSARLLTDGIFEILYRVRGRFVTLSLYARRNKTSWREALGECRVDVESSEEERLRPLFKLREFLKTPLLSSLPHVLCSLDVCFAGVTFDQTLKDVLRALFREAGEVEVLRVEECRFENARSLPGLLDVKDACRAHSLQFKATTQRPHVRDIWDASEFLESLAKMPVLTLETGWQLEILGAPLIDRTEWYKWPRFLLHRWQHAKEQWPRTFRLRTTVLNGDEASAILRLCIRGSVQTKEDSRGLEVYTGVMASKSGQLGVLRIRSPAFSNWLFTLDFHSVG